MAQVAQDIMLDPTSALTLRCLNCVQKNSGVLSIRIVVFMPLIWQPECPAILRSLASLQRSAKKPSRSGLVWTLIWFYKLWRSQISAGILLGLAIIVAGVRTLARFYKSHSFAVDDGFFFLAIITFISGTTVLYIDIPYIYLQEDVEAGLRPSPTTLVSQLIHSEKLQDAATTLLGTTIICVKFSFLFFFRGLLKKQRKMLLWWWCIFVFLLPTAAILMFSNFISCSYFNRRILGQFHLKLEHGTLHINRTLF